MRSKLTDDRTAQICTLLRAGTTVDLAAEATGISRRTFYDWLERDPDFRQSVDEAKAQAEATLVARVAKASAAGSWQAAAWLLERRWPQRWAKGPRPESNELANDPFAFLDDLTDEPDRRQT
jgi:transposase